jgi:hypothetical protein
MNASNFARFSLLAFVGIVALSAFAGAQTPGNPVNGAITPIANALCGGTSGANGIIPASPIVGAGSQGTAGVVGLTTLIMLTILLVLAALYMVSQAAKLPSLNNFVKTELAEVVGTAILIGIFFGAFYATAFATVGVNPASTTNPTLHFSGPARSVFVGDCVALGTSSFDLAIPVFVSGTINYALQAVSSINLKITPGGFGFTMQPLGGLALVINNLTTLQDLMSGIVVAILAMTFLLAFVYSIFPLFLYLGIILRAFPWTRAAGGILIAMFIGFYIVFPLMLNATTSGLNAIVTQSISNYYSSNSVVGISNSISNVSNTYSYSGSFSSFGGSMSYITNILGSIIGYPNSYGLINGFIADFMGPAILVVVEIAISFIIALDFADIVSDMLGAPSLTTEGLLRRLL